MWYIIIHNNLCITLTQWLSNLHYLQTVVINWVEDTDKKVIGCIASAVGSSCLLLSEA